jgi:integrase
LRLDEIGVGEIAAFRASLIRSEARLGGSAEHGGGRKAKRPLSEKRINNILTVLSKALRYANDVRLIDFAPKVGMLKVERPEFVCWDLAQYKRILDAAKEEGGEWYAAACLAGEAGLRIGEIRALRWREDVDLVAATITINQQTRKGITGTPKGRTRRTVPMTSTLLAALKQLSVVRTGFVVRNADGTALSDGICCSMIRRICRRAGLPERGWHVLRHSFGTHAAMFGVNPWKLMTWMGHKRIDETMLYVNFAGNHLRELPAEVVMAPGSEIDPDRRILKMLGARGILVASGAAAEHESVSC